jgi:hypothetical protein
MTDASAYDASTLDTADAKLVRELLVSEKDVFAFEKALAAIRTGRALALVGAGFSARLAYPSWEKLVSTMAEEAREQSALSSSRGAAVRHLNPAIDQFDDILWRAEEYRMAMREERFGRFLANIFGTSDKTDFCVDAVVRLPFQHILTTNYETSLERSHAIHRPTDDVTVVNWDDENAVLQLMYALVDDAPGRRYVYLHGRIDQGSARPASSVILTDRDYTRRYLRDDRTVRKLFAIFAMRRVCFFGFSLTDPDLTAILRQVAAALGYERPRHFAFIGVKTEAEKELHRKRLRNKFGIEGIFYTKENNHGRLEQVMRVLLRSCGVTVSEPAVTTAVEKPPVNKEDPNKGQFGGEPIRNGRILRCTSPVESGAAGWFMFTLSVEAYGTAPRLDGPVVFHLHNTFTPDTIVVDPVAGVARLDLTSYGAFTVGVDLDDGTKLELDLASLADAPQEFREN